MQMCGSSKFECKRSICSIVQSSCFNQIARAREKEKEKCILIYWKLTYTIERSSLSTMRGAISKDHSALLSVITHRAHHFELLSIAFKIFLAQQRVHRP